MIKNHYSRFDKRALGGVWKMPTIANPTSQLCTQNQFEEPIYLAWCNIMHQPMQYHRKQWEFVYICRVLERYDKLVPLTYGVGFGVGLEPLPAMFATRSVMSMATDMPKGIDSMWARTNQWAGNIDHLLHPEICSDDLVRRFVEYMPVDMNNIPDTLIERQFDFAWSACSLDHLGTLQNGLDFIRNAMKCVVPGGVGVFTTELNLSDDQNTIEAGPTVLYRKSDLLTFAAQLEDEGLFVAPFDFDQGDMPYDTYVDEPPYAQKIHLRLRFHGFVITSVGLIVTKQ